MHERVARAMLTMIHSNPALVQDGRLLIDRKFHHGMLNYVERLGDRITTVNPAGKPGAPVMDPIEVPLVDLGYRMLVVDDPERPETAEALAGCIRASSLVYGEGMGADAMARVFDVPQVAILEYDLATQISVSAADVRNPLRKLSRTLKTAWRYRRSLERWRGLTALHCNGYPIFDATASCHADRLLYLDSRMGAAMVIDAADLEQRLARPPGRLKLLYSGRFEPIKGALECVKAAIACREKRIDIELHCYGQGSQRDAMEALAERAGCSDRIVVHPAVPYPELVRLSRGFDVFVCCHVQADPSCTYLESLGAGLPIVGYANTMWRRLCEESGAGFHAPMYRPERVAEAIGRLSADRTLLARMSRLAHAFAASHTFEREFEKRTDDIRRLMRRQPVR